MSESNLQDDVDKLSQILAEPDPEEWSGKHDNYLCNSRGKIEVEVAEPLLRPNTSPSEYADKLLKVIPGSLPEKSNCGQLADVHPSAVTKLSAVGIKESLHVQHDSCEPADVPAPPNSFRAHGNGDVDQGLELDCCPDQKLPDVREEHGSSLDVLASRRPGPGQLSTDLGPAFSNMGEPQKQRRDIEKRATIPGNLDSAQMDEHAIQAEESSINAEDQEPMEQRENATQPSHLPIEADSASAESRPVAPEAPPKTGGDSAVDSSQTQRDGSGRLQASEEDLNHPFIFDDPPDMDENPGEGASSGGLGLAGGGWLGVGRPVELRNDVDKLSQALGSQDGDEAGDRDGGDEGGDRADGGDPPMDWSEGTAPRAEAGESSGLQGDINKLSRALATPPAAPPVDLGPFSPPAVVPSSGHSQSGERGVRSGLPSVASGLGDEVLSQDDFLDDTFIGQHIPVNLENCLALNAAYQEVVDENLADLERLLRRNRARQRDLAEQLKTEPACRPARASRRARRWPWSLFVFNHFTDAEGFGPLPNADTRVKTARGEFEEMRQGRPWVQSERERLFEAVVVDARRRHEQPLCHRVVAASAALDQQQELNESERDEAALKTLRSRLADAERGLSDAKAASVVDILFNLDDGYDWHYIALRNMDDQRTPKECRLQWCNFVKPTISHAEWTGAEDERVRAAAEDTVSVNPWQRAADDLGRTAFQVFQRHVTVLSAPTGRVFWTPEETERLICVVRDVRIGNFIKWSLVAACMEGRTGGQCNQRYLRVAPHVRRGQFSEEEDLRIVAAVETAGMTNWRAIAAHVPGRSSDQLRMRYFHRLAPHLSYREWSRGEDEKLVRFVREHGPMWSRAARELGGDRSDSHCRMRFRRIEFAFQCRGGVPATGGLAGPSRGVAPYYDGLRDKLSRRLAHYMPDGVDDAEARKQAALKFLQRKMPCARSKGKWRPRMREKLAAERQARRSTALRWSELGDMVVSEGRQPYRRVQRPDPAANAAAAAATARAWCLPRLTADQVDACASAGQPVTQHDADALVAWRDALAAESESPAREVVSAVGLREYNWRRMPLLPASFATCSAFRSLMLQRPRLEDYAVEHGGPSVTRQYKTKMFNLDVAHWAAGTMSGGDDGAEGATPWLMPTDQTRHLDRMVRVRVTQQEPHKPPRQFMLTVAASEADNPHELAGRLRRQIPHMVKMDISRVPVVRDSAQPAPAPGPPPPADAADAWHLLLARFVSTFFWPALLSLQPSPGVSDLSRPDMDGDMVDSIFGGLLVVDSDDEAAEASATRKRPAGTTAPRPPAKRRTKRK